MYFYWVRILVYSVKVKNTYSVLSNLLSILITPLQLSTQLKCSPEEDNIIFGYNFTTLFIYYFTICSEHSVILSDPSSAQQENDRDLDCCYGNSLILLSFVGALL